MLRAVCKNCGLGIRETTEGVYSQVTYWIHDHSAEKYCDPTRAVPQEGPKEWGFRNHPIVPKPGEPEFCQRCSGRSDDAIHHTPSEHQLEAERKARR